MLDFEVRRETFPIEVLEIDGLGVTFSTSQRLPIGRTIYVRDVHQNDARVNVYQRRRTLQGGWLCFATIYEGMLAAAAHRHEPIRRQPRHRIHLKVSSDLVPGHAAAACDLSLEGVRLRLNAPLEVRENIEIDLEPGDGRRPLTLWASVRWARMSPPYYAGLQFMGVTVAERKRLEDLLATRRKAVPVTDDLPDGPVGEDTYKELLDQPLYLQDSYLEDDDLILVFTQDYRIIEQRFRRPVLRENRFRRGFINGSNGVSAGNGLSRYRFTGDNGSVVFEIDSTPPEITVRTA